MVGRSKCQRTGAVWAIVQGLSLALFPQRSIAVIKRLVGQKFENAAELQARPAYRRGLRALGVGAVAAGLANLLLDEVAADSAEAVETTDETPETS